MRAEIAEEWARRLDSGEYKQGTGLLRQLNPMDGEPDLYCCWGVLCEMAVEAGVVARELFSYEAAYGYGDANTTHMPPLVVYNWAGILKPNGSVEDWSALLAELNDDETPFPTIANRIRRYAINGVAYDTEYDPENDPEARAAGWSPNTPEMLLSIMQEMKESQQGEPND